MRNHKILIADDSSVDAERIRQALSSLGRVELSVVDDGAAAVQRAQQSRFDLVLCDYEMPGLNGLQVVRLLRARWSRLELPILMLTVRDDVQTKVASLRQGASDYVTKPVEPDELLARVQAHLSLRLAVEENLGARLQIFEMRKFESIGRLAAALAHELNSPAQFAADNIVFLQKAFNTMSELLVATRHGLAAPASESQRAELDAFWQRRQLDYLLGEAPNALQEALDGIMRMARIVRELKEFAGPPGSGWGLWSLNRAIENTVAVSRHLWAAAARISCQLEPSLPLIACDVTALKHAFFNILSTMIEAEPERAAPLNVEITSRAVETGIEVEFHDDGPGTSPGLEPEMFRPSNAAPAPELSHTLCVAYSVVVGQHAGRLLRTSEPSAGTTYVVHVPFASNPAR